MSLENTVQERTHELKSERAKLEKHNREMEHEVTLARNIQEQLIPAPNPTEYIYSLYRPMAKVGGDFYDFVFFENSDKIGIFISDVSGHGVPAAFITSMIKMTILQAGSRTENPSALLLYLNEVLKNQTAGNFITAFYCIYDPEDNSIVYSNAGHPRPYLISDNGVAQLHESNNIALAVFPNNQLTKNNNSYVNLNATLPVNSKLLLYTDGFTETRPLHGSGYFEYSGMYDVLLKNSDLPCKFFTEKLLESIIEFRGSGSFEDDVCIVCLDVR